jgi:hypothetical protein
VWLGCHRVGFITRLFVARFRQRLSEHSLLTGRRVYSPRISVTLATHKIEYLVNDIGLDRENIALAGF